MNLYAKACEYTWLGNDIEGESHNLRLGYIHIIVKNEFIFNFLTNLDYKYED